MKTPMQEMLEWVRATLPMDLDTSRMIEEKIESMLEKEKEVMYDAWLVAISNFRNDTFFEEYYNETFNTKEK